MYPMRVPNDDESETLQYDEELLGSYGIFPAVCFPETVIPVRCAGLPVVSIIRFHRH